jgi:hypothetical protein
LHECAAQNLVNYRSKSQQCFNLKAICADAVNYKLPLTPLVLYFSSPFGQNLMQPVVQDIFGSFQQHPREGYLIYNHIGYFPDVDVSLLGMHWLKLVSDKGTYRIYGIRLEDLR